MSEKREVVDPLGEEFEHLPGWHIRTIVNESKLVKAIKAAIDNGREWHSPFWGPMDRMTDEEVDERLAE